MAKAKLTMLFQASSGTGPTDQTARVRVGGWSESWYLDHWPLTSNDNIRFGNLMRSRAALLPTNALIVGQRYQQVEPVGASSTGAKVYPGRAQAAQDIPQMALYCRVRSSDNPNIRPMYLRALPDARVFRGEYYPSSTYDQALNDFFAELRNFRFRGADLVTGLKDIRTIGADGSVYCYEAHGLAVGNKVTILRSEQASTGNLVGGQYRVATVVSSTTVTLNAWPHGIADGGQLRPYSIVYPTVGEVDIARVVTRKVGRPFDQYRGRAGTRR